MYFFFFWKTHFQHLIQSVIQNPSGLLLKNWAQVPIRIRLIQSDVALKKDWLKSKMDYMITDHTKRITKSGSILSGLNLLKKKTGPGVEVIKTKFNHVCPNHGTQYTKQPWRQKCQRKWSIPSTGWVINICTPFSVRQNCPFSRRSSVNFKETRLFMEMLIANDHIRFKALE